MSPPPAAARAKNRLPIIATVDEYDKIAANARKRVAPHAESKKNGHHHEHNHANDCGHDHDHHGLTKLSHALASKTAHSGSSTTFRQCLAKAQHLANAIMNDGESRSIFLFLLLNLSYMFVQLTYGYMTNSLGLISDAIHMLFDCLALAIGLVAAVMSKWPSNETFTFGYGRIEILSGFANGVFLMLISVSIFFEAIERLIYPPEMNTQRLLLVSFGGLVVNLFGIFAFNGHHHHHHHHHDHDYDHNHSHANGCSHGHGGHGHHRSQNMQGVFLHVMADTLGSVGVIISTLLIQQFGWTGFDPLASIAIASLIFASVVPLVRDSMHMLLLRLPDQPQADVSAAIDQIISDVPGIADLPKVQFWPITESQIMGIIHARASLVDTLVKEEVPLCPIAVRNNVTKSIENIVRTHVSGLRDVFVQVDIIEEL
ncbi:hypothetical protein GGI25_000561 [Coemansia spiralis]|uniref:Cation efflux protein transmembrane domain-containing protein n=2 Tax=Coemansia TaxID=4863 RepID=A0A9W8GEL7_9FUNG|nr:cation efflux family-domain-containing protein [Coemansia spiralis]KAJ1996022.1 hypothetical protein EDC05_000390 [Coemansia umbellata]KAJ2625465.1 hypothetical protein GGI26_000605 [Coemansia sp. RSA 1358]KAJ2680588.1 hypothetical protein GGI25_000561 [Coemansia spiralis]